MARTCTLILIVLDATKPMTHKRIIERELEGFGIRLNKRPPDITVVKKEKGGISIVRQQGIELTKMSEDTVKSIVHEYKIPNGDVVFRQDSTIDELIDVCEGNRVYMPCIYVLNKID